MEGNPDGTASNSDEKREGGCVCVASSAQHHREHGPNPSLRNVSDGQRAVHGGWSSVVEIGSCGLLEVDGSVGLRSDVDGSVGLRSDVDEPRHKIGA